MSTLTDGRPLEGKVALVTGASSGIGEATAIAFARLGADLALVARREERLQALADRVREQGVRASVIAGDLTDEHFAQEVVRRTHDEYGRLDILVNNAGIMLLGPALEATVDDWKRMVDINLMATLYATHAALPLMKEQGSGHVVNVSSVSGRGASPTSAVYSATKWGVGGFSDSIRQEVHKYDIRVTLIEPGVVATELTDHMTHEATRESYVGRTSTWRRLESEDVAAAIVYAVTQPLRVNVNEILLRPIDQG